ncbi:MAG TPA: type 4a pilus biogenesis protein PilO [Vicinamibacterales bacterium]|nr:type 4a pilus biogenesis protein PilO [Vicinamibacterales bacterium]HPK72862.1 type 4a pilus biogenesis protein PilO [Vicinamibacterales bacterium]HPW20909.1 type 4a pilus biogenesis protein PilO [Vicinamibacterales bacterium]
MDLNLHKLPWYAQVGLFVALAVAGVAAFYYLYAMPADKALDAQRQRLATLRVDISRGMAIARQLPQFRAQVADLEGRLEGLKAILPDEKDFGELLRNLQTLAVQSNLSIRVFKPAPVVTQPLHAEWPINIELDGTYHNLGLFFERISRFPRIINVGNISVKGKDKPDQNTSISVACVATTFVLLDGAQAPAAAKPAQASPSPAAAKPAAGGRS